jgi:PAS domain S-box-containing protein
MDKVCKTRKELQSGKKLHREFKFRRKDGSILWTLASVTPKFDGTGNHITNLVMNTDITERKKAEEALRRSENIFRNLVEQSIDGIVMINSHGIITEWNTSEERITGLSRSEVLGRPMWEIDYSLMSDERKKEISFEQMKSTMMEILRNKQSPILNRTRELEIIRSDGALRHVRLSLFLVNLEDDFRSVVFQMTFTERRKAEDELVRAKDELEIRVQERTVQLEGAYNEILQSQKSLKEANKQLKQYTYKITRVQEEERKRIAYELHDDTAQYLSILKMQIGALAESGEIQSPKVKKSLQFLEKDADRAFNDVRRYSHELRPVVLEHQGLVAAFEQIADDYNKLGQLSVEFQIEGIEPEISEDVKLGFYRIAQEALNNTRKHAQASRAYIDLKFYRKQIQMTVRDNGVGFDIKQAVKRSEGKGSLGLMSMRERAELIDADLKIDSEPGKGTKVCLKAMV